MRRNAIVRLCIWAVVSLSLIGLLATWFINDTNIFQSGGISFMSLGLSSYRYKNADRYTAGNTDLSDQVTSLDIDWISGSVTVLSYDGDTVRIREDDDIEDPDHQVHWFLEGGKLHIKYAASKFFLHTLQSKKLTVEIPNGMARNLSSVKIESVSASVDLRGHIQTSEMHVESVSGSINLREITVNSLDLDTVSGTITGTDLCTSLVDIETISGEVSLAGEIGSGSLETTSGEVTLSSTQQFKSLDLESVSGDITLICPLGSALGYRVVFESVSGDIETEIPYKKQGNNYTFGSGENVYNFESVSGDLIIKEP